MKSLEKVLLGNWKGCNVNHLFDLIIMLLCALKQNITLTLYNVDRCKHVVFDCSGMEI